MKKAPCNDCGKDTQPETKVGRPLFKKYDTYIVRFEVWSQAGMDGWASGFLCTPCLSKRLGRELTVADYLCRPIRANSEGVEMEAHPDYLDYVKSVQKAHNGQ